MRAEAEEFQRRRDSDRARLILEIQVHSYKFVFILKNDNELRTSVTFWRTIASIILEMDI